MKKLALLAPANSIHTKRWVVSLSKTYKITLFTLHHPTFEYVDIDVIRTKKTILGFFMLVFWIWVYLFQHKPHIIHAHYASSYGTLLNFIMHKKKVLSVWGSDIYEFPERSFLHRLIIKLNLNNANILTSTSRVMAQYASKYTNKKFFIVPFGVNISNFCPFSSNKFSLNTKKFDKIRIGTVKSLSEKYGIDTFLYAIKYIKDNFNYFYLILNCEIYGTGPDLDKLKFLTKKLQILDKVTFCGHINHEAVPLVLNNLDIFVCLSRFNSESFGVAVVEAQACGVPVIVSDVGGLIEVVENKITGIIVPKDDHISAANAIIKLIKNNNLRNNLSIKAREVVETKFDFKNNVDQMLKIYSDI